MTAINRIWEKIIRYRYSVTISYVVIACAIGFLLANALLFYFEFQSKNVDPVSIIGLMLLILIAFLFLGILVVNNRITNVFAFIKRGKKGGSKLRKRIIIAFSLGAAIPTIIVAVFSTYFFNFGVQSWFDEKVSRVLDQSIIVGENYITEHVMNLRDTALSISKDLSDVYYKMINDPDSFQKFLAGEADFRNLDEAIVFKKDSNTVLAQTSLSFSLSFLTIPAYVFEKVDKGEIVRISSDPTRIRILIKLTNYNNTYLLIGRLVDEKIIDHINKTNGAAAEYFRLKNQIAHLQVKFSMIFILLAMILLLAAIIWGRYFAYTIVKPIRELVIAAEKVKNGDLTARVPEENLKKDEIRILSSSFNRMVRQIDCQQKDLLIAQRALAWSDVARRVAHEIKNPLTPIQLSADRLLKKFKGEVKDQNSFAKYIDNITRHSNDIKTIVSEFVNFARLPAPEFTKCQIVSMISYLVDSRKLINENISYNFKSNVDSLELVCDIAQINQVMINLLQNSEDAFDTNSKNKEIIVSITSDKNFISISILDNGNGFDKEVLGNATKAYFTTKAKGMGLGLAIVSRIVQDHFGIFAIFNREEGGAAVKLTFNTDELNIKLK